jgi:transcriptional regulator with XRE-family HTH domain
MQRSIGERIKILREIKSLSLAKLGSLCGINGSTLCRIEGTPVSPRIETLTKVARALEVRVSCLLGDIPELENMDPSQVASRESLILFLKEIGSESKADRFWLIVDHPGAPKTIEGWRAFGEMAHLYRKRKARKPGLKTIRSVSFLDVSKKGG